MIRRILVIIGYVCVMLFVVALTFVLVAYGNDYTYDFQTHQIIQKGHVIIESVPSGTQVTADGRSINKRTPYQAVWSVGQHAFGLTRDGFWPWSKTLDVLPGQVSLVNYAIMVPKQPARTVLDGRTAFTPQAISKDHRHMAYIEPGVNAALYTLDISGGKPAKLYTAAVASATKPAEALDQVTWSDDASHLLLRSRMGDAVTYRLLTAGSSDSIDLTEQYKFDFAGLAFSANNWRQLYWVSGDGGLRRLDVEAQSVSAVLADKVSQFWVAPDRVLYVQQNDLGRSLWSLDKNGKRQRLIDSLVQSSGYALAYSTFGGQDELALVPASTGVGTLYSGILSDNPTAKVVAHDVVQPDFTPDGSIVAFSSAKQIVTYDLQRTRLTGKPAIATITDQPGVLQRLTWFDNAHLLTIRDGQLYFSEYDGANRVNLGAVAADAPAEHSSDFKSIYVTQPGRAAGTQELVSLAVRP
ncbi:MAG TPA: PEGA domain-containing protein [Candidatus Saccharimonadia bacterium]